MKTNKNKIVKESESPSITKTLGPFDFLTSINDGSSHGEDLLELSTAHSSQGMDLAANDRGYVSFIINRGLSYFADTVLFANEMNRYHSLPVKMQYTFLKGLIRRRKRFSKWGKRPDDTLDVEMIKAKYSINSERARSYLKLLTPQQVSEIRNTNRRGGMNSTKGAR